MVTDKERENIVETMRKASCVGLGYYLMSYVDRVSLQELSFGDFRQSMLKVYNGFQGIETALTDAGTCPEDYEV